MKATATAKNSKLTPDSRGPERVAVLTTGARSTRTLDAYPNTRVRNDCSPVESGDRVPADAVPIRRAADPHLRQAARRYVWPPSPLNRAGSTRDLRGSRDA